MLRKKEVVVFYEVLTTCIKAADMSRASLLND